MKAMGETFTPPIVCPTLVGRADHLATLHHLVEQARRGEGRLVLMSGEAGIGKSRLVAETKTHATAQGFLLLQGNCFPADHNCPYAPLLDLLRSLFNHPPGATTAVDLETFARDLFPLLPELAPASISLPPMLEPEQEKRRLFAVIAGFLSRLSAQQPVLLVVEDIHWSDDTSMDFLHSLARRCASLPLLLLITYRHDELRPPLMSWLAQLDRERLAQEIRLVQLSRNNVDTMLSAIFDQQHTAFDMRRFLHSELLDTIYALTEGNPFFVEEILTSLIAAGDIFYAHGYWNHMSLSEGHIPRSVQDAVQRRTEQLSQDARHILTLAAVAGRRFDFTILQQLTHHDEEQLLQIMKELLSAQLVVEESAERFAFRHALTREAIYTGLLTRERARLHRIIAETIERLTSQTLGTRLGEIAYHFYQARDWQKVVDYAQRAGEQALMLYTSRAAIDYFSWALVAADHLSHPPSPMLYLARGQAYDTLGEFEQARRDYIRALETAHEANDRLAEWQSMINLGILWEGRDYAQAETWFRQALALAQTLHDPALQARSLNRIGNWYLNKEQSHEALHYHQQALIIFQGLQDSHGIAETLDLLGMTSYLGGDLSQGSVYYQQAITLFRELDDRQGLASSLATLTLRGATFQTDTMVSAATSLAEVLHDCERALRIAREIGQRSAEAYALFQLGLCLGSQGEYTQAMDAAQQSLKIAEEIEHRQWQTAAHAILGGIYSSMLAISPARQHFEQALTLAHQIGSLFWTFIATGYLASASIQMNELAQAELVLHDALNPDTPAQSMAQRMMWCARAELALAQRNPTRALEIVDYLFASAAHLSEGSSILRVAKLRGEALAAMEHPADAEAALKAAQAIAMAQEVRPMQWRISATLGNVYQSQGRSIEAEQEFSAARVLIEELAANVADEPLRDNLLRQATALLPRKRPPSPGRSTKQAFGGLTEREREVVTLIAQGKSNQAIADALVVTRRTIETHVGNIMFKLNCTSRTQIAVWAVETGLVDKTE
jgi:predicted ATPase/DNA-binding NarL/FixJ family response regulator